MTAPRRLILYSTGACHLCEQALALVRPLLKLEMLQPGMLQPEAGQPSLQSEVVLEEVDIANSDELTERYGLIIPVLRDPATGRELHWPFSADDVLALLG